MKEEEGRGKELNDVSRSPSCRRGHATARLATLLGWRTGLARARARSERQASFRLTLVGMEKGGRLLHRNDEVGAVYPWAHSGRYAEPA